MSDDDDARVLLVVHVTATRSRRRDGAVAFGEQAAFVRTLPCCACVWLQQLQRGTTQAHHEPPRSVGGLDAHTLPLCADHHRRRHDVGASQFWRELGPGVLARVREAVAARTRVLPGDPCDGVPW